MWHCSVAASPGVYHVSQLEKLARYHLHNVGASGLGEWTEYHMAFHLRRRLAPHEQASVGDARDLRGTPAAMRRYLNAYAKLPAPAQQLGREEIMEHKTTHVDL